MEELIKKLNEESNFTRLVDLIFDTNLSCSGGGGGGGGSGGGGAGDCGSCQTH